MTFYKKYLIVTFLVLLIITLQQQQTQQQQDPIEFNNQEYQDQQMEQIQEEYQQQQQDPEPNPQSQEQQKYFQDYSQYMGGFQATEVFQFNMAAHGYEQFLIPINQDVESLRGLYYIQSDSDKNLLLWIQRDSQHLVNQINKKMHVFRIDNMKKGNIKVFFKNMNQEKFIFFTYELILKNKIPNTLSTNQLIPAVNKFLNLSTNVQAAHVLIKSLIHQNINHAQQLFVQKNHTLYYAIFQVLILLTVGGISLYLLNKVIKKGYVSVI